jgi:hypothetical protein
MGALCGENNAAVPACTQFVLPKLTLVCRGEAREWSMSASARFIAIVYVLNHRYVAHEMMHIADLKADTTRHIHELEKRRYGDAAACEQDAFAETGVFRDRIASFAAASMAVRH